MEVIRRILDRHMTVVTHGLEIFELDGSGG